MPEVDQGKAKPSKVTHRGSWAVGGKDDTGDNAEAELNLQRARREIEAEANFHATVTIDDIECERAIISADSEGMDGDSETVIERPSSIPDGQPIKWPDHFPILWGAGGVGFTKQGTYLALPSIWAGYDDKRRLDGIESIEFLLNLPDRYGEKCSFVMFSFNYDVTMLLKGGALCTRLA